MRRLFWIWASVFAIWLTAGSPVFAASAVVGAGERTRLDLKASVSAAGYKVFWRPTIAAQWFNTRDAGAGTSLMLRSVNIDDNFLGVSAVSADGYVSPIKFPGPTGAFAPNAQ
jgi:hypothetical protein